MDQTMLERHLAQAERHVARGKIEIGRQRAIVADMERDGHDASNARHLLRQFEELLAMHTADRDRLRRELGQ